MQNKKFFRQSVACVMLSMITLAGCGQATKPPSQATPISTHQKTGTVAAKALTEYLMTTMGSAIVGMNKLVGKQVFTKKHIDCFTQTANNKLEKNLQSVLQNNFSQQEIQAIDSYFASPLGKKNLEIPKAQLNALLNSLNNESKPANVATKAEEKQMQAFWQSDVGTKLASILGNEDKQLESAMAAIVKEKETVCKMPKPALQ